MSKTYNPAKISDPYLKDTILTEPTNSTCPVCQEQNVYLIHFTKAILPGGVKLKSVIIGNHKAIGLSCGCYAKLHRQIAHIADRLKK